MAEEIVNLTGSRLDDERYSNNVIFDVDGLNNLLQHIKNYPIIDIDTIGETDKDELNNNLIWENYTNGTPCIKLIYGDSNNINGNLTQTDVDEIRELEEQIKLYTGVMNIIQKYNTIESEYKTLIGNLEEEVKKIIENVCIRQHNLLNSNSGNFECRLATQETGPYPIQANGVSGRSDIEWRGSLYSILEQTKTEDNKNRLNSDFWRLYDTNATWYILDGLYYKINYKVTPFENKIEQWISTNSIDLSDCFEVNYGKRTINDQINKIEPQNDIYTIIPLIPQQQPDNLTANILKNYAIGDSNFLADVFQVDSLSSAKADELRAIFSKYNDEIVKLNDLLDTGAEELSTIKTLLKKYITQLRDARYIRYEEIRKYLLANGLTIVHINPTTSIDLRNLPVTAYGTTAYNQISQYILNNYENKNQQDILDQIQSITDDCVDSKYVKIINEPYDANINNGRGYYIFNEESKRYERVYINSFDDIKVNGQNPQYYVLMSNTNPAIYGYKYVKVGSNITWDNNKVYPFNPSGENARNSGSFIYPEVNPGSDQRNGHFRITINGHTYEIGIKGFDNDSNDNLNSINNLIAGTSIIPNINSVGTNSGYNLGSSTSQWNTIYARGAIFGNNNADAGASNVRPYSNNTGSLGTESARWGNIYGGNGYFDTITPFEAQSPANGTSLGDASHIWSSAYINQIGDSSHPVQTLYVDNLLPKDGSDSNTTTNLGSTSAPWTNAYITTIHTSNLTGSGTSGSVIIGNAGSSSSSLGAAQLVPAAYTDSSLGSTSAPWTSAYITTGRFDNINIKMGNNYTDLLTYINSQVTYDDDHQLKVTNTTDGIKQGSSGTATNGFSSSYTGTYYGDTTASIYTKGGIYAEKNIIATRVFNAVFNDYAECRTTIDLTPGHVVVDQDDGSLACSSKRLQPGAQVISDTYGHLMGGTDKARTPIAVAGRVLVYTYQPRENYHAGMAVCSAPDGTVDIMSRAEICEYPDCIVGIVSEIPQYETWGSDNVKVDGRIWIKVK